jgi:hypothetical protein
VIFDAEFVAYNGLRTAEANERLRKDADGTIGKLSELESLLRL